jgi:MoxR-like ATPase
MSQRPSMSGTTANNSCASKPVDPRAASGEEWHDLEEDIFAEEFMLTRPLLEAISAKDPVVLLIDEVDRVELETEALMLEILSEYQVSIPELGTIRAQQIPMVFLTSNNTRELSEALEEALSVSVRRIPERRA